jgi:ABC-2 type transport system permease protein
MTTHYLDEAERLCDRLAVIDAGTVVACDSPASLLASLGDEILELRVDQTDKAAKILYSNRVAPQDVLVIGGTVTASLRGIPGTRLANSVASAEQRTTYMTYIALATAGLLIPLNCMFSGIGVVVDREHGAMRELLVAPIRRSSIVAGNLVAAIATTALQMAVLIVASTLRGAAYQTGRGVLWLAGAALLFSAVMYGLAEIVASRVPSPEAYIGVLPAIAIVPFFFAGSLFPITSLPSWLAGIAKVLPLTHALALFRYGLTPANGGTQALRNTWGMSDDTTMAALSMLVVGLYAVALMAGAIRLFIKKGAS